MRWSIDPPVTARGVVCAAITQSDVNSHAVGQTSVFHGNKHPRLILLQKDGGIRGVDLRGRVYDAAEIESLYPDAIAQMTEVVGR